MANLSPSVALFFSTYGGVGGRDAIAVDSMGVYVTGGEFKPTEKVRELLRK